DKKGRCRGARLEPRAAPRGSSRPRRRKRPARPLPQPSAAPLARSRLAAFGRRRLGDRFLGAAMAGVATYLGAPVEIVLIDGVHHAQHAAGNTLGVLGIAGEISLDMAEAALHA